MKRIRILGLALIAVFAMSAVAVSSASAAPEYKTCVKATEKNAEKVYTDGEYSNKACSGAAEAPSTTTKYKLAAYNEGKKKLGTKGKNIGNPVNRQIFPALNAAVADVECEKEKSVGELTSSSTSTSKVEYSKCKSSEGKKCGKVGEASKGKITTEPLKTQLIDQPGSTEGIGIVISPVTGTVLAVYECEGGLKVTAIGGVEGEIEGGATAGAVKAIKIKFSKSSGGVYQQWGYFGANEAENEAKFKAFFNEESAEAPNAFIVSHIEGNTNPALPPEFTLPATQEGTTEIKGESLKIVG